LLLSWLSQVLLIIISAFALDHLVRPVSIIGITLFSLFCGMYTYLVVGEKRALLERHAQDTAKAAAAAVACGGGDDGSGRGGDDGCGSGGVPSAGGVSMGPSCATEKTPLIVSSLPAATGGGLFRPSTGAAAHATSLGYSGGSGGGGGCSGGSGGGGDPGVGAYSEGAVPGGASTC
jgi:hypothetical protein